MFSERANAVNVQAQRDLESRILEERYPEHSYVLPVTPWADGVGPCTGQYAGDCEVANGLHFTKSGILKSLPFCEAVMPDDPNDCSDNLFMGGEVEGPEWDITGPKADFDLQENDVVITIISENKTYKIPASKFVETYINNLEIVKPTQIIDRALSVIKVAQTQEPTSLPPTKAPGEIGRAKDGGLQKDRSSTKDNSGQKINPPVQPSATVQPTIEATPTETQVVFTLSNEVKTDRGLLQTLLIGSGVFLGVWGSLKVLFRRFRAEIPNNKNKSAG